MDNTDDKNIFHALDNIFDVGKDGDAHALANVSLTVGVIVDTDDPLQNGRLRIFCPSLNDSPEKIHHLPWAAYVSPFGGRINNGCFTRAADPDNCTTEGTVHYGFWGIPEQGGHAVVACIDGDPRRRVWLGCIPSNQETHTLFNGRFKWTGFNGTPDGPFSSTNKPIQPLYDNLSIAFNGNKNSQEWRTRGADYTPTAVDQDVGQVPNVGKDSYLDEQNTQISSAEPDEWVKSILGANGYDWTSFKNLGAFKSSKVYGFSSPGMHSLMMDDRAFNSRTKLRTAGGHILLMDDTNERIYIATEKGNNWIELDSNGNIDIYSKRRVSIHSESDINFSTDSTFRVTAKKGIYMYAGNTPGTPLDNTPADGQIRFQSDDDIHIHSGNNIRQLSIQKTFIESGSDINVKSVNWLQQASTNYGITADSVTLLATTKIIESVGSSNFQIDTTSIASVASADVFFSGGGIAGSITSINATFLTKMDEAGAALITATAPTITPPTINALVSGSQITVWTNRVPQHEPWPRVLMQDSGDSINQSNNGYLDNVNWVMQYDNSTSPDGLKPIGKVEGDVTITRGKFWRR